MADFRGELLLHLARCLSNLEIKALTPLWAKFRKHVKSYFATDTIERTVRLIHGIVFRQLVQHIAENGLKFVYPIFQGFDSCFALITHGQNYQCKCPLSN